MITQYKVTGILTNGKRFPAIFTTVKLYALGINLRKGTVWERYEGHWKVIKRV